MMARARIAIIASAAAAAMLYQAAAGATATTGCEKPKAQPTLAVKRPAAAALASKPAKPVAPALCICPPARQKAKKPQQKQTPARQVAPADDCSTAGAGGAASSGGGISYTPPPLRLLPGADPLPVHWPAVGDGLVLPWPAAPLLPEPPALRIAADAALITPALPRGTGHEDETPILIPLPVPVPGIPEAPTWALASIGAALVYLAARRRH